MEGRFMKVDVKDTASKAKGLAGEFKEFISRGNVVDMAVGIIVGSAFTSIVNSLVKDIITPFIAWIIGDTDFTSMALTLVPASGEEPGIAIAIAYGNFIQQVMNFLIIAFVVFLMVKVMNQFRRKKEAEPAPAPEPPKPAPELEVLREIRDILEKNAEK